MGELGGEFCGLSLRGGHECQGEMLVPIQTEAQRNSGPHSRSVQKRDCNQVCGLPGLSFFPGCTPSGRKGGQEIRALSQSNSSPSAVRGGERERKVSVLGQNYLYMIDNERERHFPKAK